MTTPSADEQWLEQEAAIFRSAVATVVQAWRARETCEFALSSWDHLKTDGWGIFDGSECIASRLPLTEHVGISARRYGRFGRARVDAVRAQLLTCGVPLVALEPPYPVWSMEPIDFERAWKLHRRDANDDDYLEAARAAVHAWVIGADYTRTVRHLSIDVYRGAICATSDCIAVAAPRLRRVVLVSAKRYRAGGPPRERHRARARNAIRRALAESGFVPRDVRPVAGSGGEIRPQQLLDAWTAAAPRLVGSTGSRDTTSRAEALPV